MPLVETPDSSFFALVHHVLGSSVADADRRDKRRRQYSCVQLLAPYVAGRLPAQSEFRRVLCRDLSPAGFSYLAGRPPECEFLVVALGNAPFIFVKARVARHAPTVYEGKPLLLIGCRLIERIHEPAPEAGCPA